MKQVSETLREDYSAARLRPMVMARPGSDTCEDKGGKTRVEGSEEVDGGFAPESESCETEGEATERRDDQVTQPVKRAH